MLRKRSSARNTIKRFLSQEGKVPTKEHTSKEEQPGSVATHGSPRHKAEQKENSKKKANKENASEKVS